MAYYKFTYAELAKMAETIKTNAQKEILALKHLQRSISAFGGSTNIDGATATAMTSYFVNVYTPIITSMQLLIDHHAQECLRYIKAYDSANLGGKTQVDTNEILEINEKNHKHYIGLQSPVDDLSGWLRQAIEYEARIESPDVILSDLANIKTIQEEINRKNKKVITDIGNIESQYKTQNDYVKQLKASLNSLLKKMRSTEGENYLPLNKTAILNSREMHGMHTAALALWYFTSMSQDDRENLGLEKIYKNQADLENIHFFNPWMTEKDIEEFRKLQYLPYDEWPDKFKPYFSWTELPNGYPRNGKGGNCTWYAFGRYMMMQGLTFETGPGGDAFDWFRNAAVRGYKTGQKPVVGSILCWDYGWGSDGHVAVVEKIIRPNSKYPYGAVVVSQSSHSGSGKEGYFSVDICPINEDGSVSMVYNGYARSGVEYQGCILPNKNLRSGLNTPFGPATNSDKAFLTRLSKGNNPPAYIINEKDVVDTPMDKHVKSNPDPKTNGMARHVSEGHSATKGNPDPKTNGTLHNDRSVKQDTHSKTDPDPKTNGGMKHAHSSGDSSASKDNPDPKTNSEARHRNKTSAKTQTNRKNENLNTVKDAVSDAINTGPSEDYKPTQQSEPVTRLSELDTESLQGKLGVTVDGEIGPETISAIQKEVGATVDGYWGTETSAKLQEYLGVEVDGYASTETLTALNEWAGK